ncbi:MAG: hypothetical protein KC563_14335, partial [Nitrospira sp.]|nr:hypothetical protein [Nitrospira sp.]
MKQHSQWFGMLVMVLCVGGCETPQFQTMSIVDTPNRVVALQVMSEAYGGKGYDHPISLTKEEMSRLLQGVRVSR